MSAGKKLLDTRHPAFLAVTNVRHQLVATWQSMSLRYPVPSVRLIRQDKIDEFNLGWWNSRKAGIIRLEGFDHVQR